METLSKFFDLIVQLPLVMLLGMVLPMFLLAWLRKTYPSKWMLLLVTIPAVLSVLLVWFTPVLWLLVGVNFGVIVIAIIDLFTVPGAKSYSATRELAKTASLEKSQDVELELTNLGRTRAQLMIRDDLPQSFETDDPEFQTALSGRSKARFKYSYRCKERGLFQLNFVHLLVNSQLRLWRAFYKLPVESSVNVYPDMKQISQYELLARTNRLSLVGVRRTRKIGQDNEFERLRDYTQDDNFKHIDWRTTARRNKLTVRDFQANQSQRIIFMIDCGRMMTNKSGDISLLDHAMNAALMLSYVALKQGDSVGLICFSDSIHNYTPPRAGVQHINRLLHAAFDQHAEFVESNYQNAFLYLKKNCLKRSLVVLVTNMIDEINSYQIQSYLGSLVGRHLPVGVLLRDHEMFQPIEQYEAIQSAGGYSEGATKAEVDRSIYTAAAAAKILSWRHQVIRDLKHKGVLALDVFPEQLTAELVNQYLEIKARHLL